MNEMKWKLIIPGKPQPWQRAKSRVGTSQAGKPFVITNTHPKNKKYQKLIKEAAAKEGVELWDGPVEILVYALFKRPSDMSRQKDPPGILRNIKEVGDVDNLLKNPMDALQGIAYTKDGQVSDAGVKKRYGEKGQQPFTEIHIIQLPKMPEPNKNILKLF